MSNELMLIPSKEVYQMAVAASKCGLFGMKTPEEAFCLMLIAQAEGLHPAIAARDYHIIEGRPTLKADAMMARFQAAGGSVRWIEMTDTRCAAIFSHPQGGEVEIDWDMARAKQAELGPGMTRSGKPNMWSKYPRQMLRARTLSEGIRAVFPGANAGTYTPEEVRDITGADDETVVGSSSTQGAKTATVVKVEKTEKVSQPAVIDVPFATIEPDPVETSRALFKKIRASLEGALNSDDLDSVMDAYRDDLKGMPETGANTLKNLYETLKAAHSAAA